MKIQSPNKKGRIKHIGLRLVIVTFIVLLGGFVVFAYNNSVWPFKPATTGSPTNSDPINYNPPTEQEIKEGQDAKKRNIEESKDINTKNNNANVGIAFSDINQDKLEIRAFITSVVEGGGKCTAVLKKNSITVTESSEAFIDSTSSQCRPIYIPVTDFAEKGTWSLYVSYKSETTSGNSATIEVEIR